VNFTVVNGFTQMVTEPTRRAYILDIMFANKTFILTDIYVNEPLASSDQCVVCFSVFMDSCNQN